MAIILLSALFMPLILEAFGFRFKNKFVSMLIRHLAIYSYATILVIRYFYIGAPVFCAYVYPALMTFLDFGLPIIAQRNIKGYINKVITDDKEEREILQKFPLFPEKYFNAALIVIVMVMITLVVGNNEGERAAYFQEEYLVSSAYSDTVIVKKYEGFLICTNLNQGLSDNKTFFLVELSDEPEIELFSQQQIPLYER
ncbi:MAG: hypothetical protein PHQ86_08740 [Dehalococcoidales bacterium]|nr:hypothetical protein [Dehalococcoidales bacterium]